MSANAARQMETVIWQSGWYAYTLATPTELFDPEQIDVGHGKGMSAFNERHAFGPSQPPV
jgi:hypothetical protein